VLEDPRKVIGDNLANRRRQLELTQREVAEAIGQDYRWVQKREYGEASIDLEELPPLMEVLMIDDPMRLLDRNAFRDELF
jgi:transcriptional regulator with XRE-family HTH domain